MLGAEHADSGRQDTLEQRPNALDRVAEMMQRSLFIRIQASTFDVIVPLTVPAV